MNEERLKLIEEGYLKNPFTKGINSEAQHIIKELVDEIRKYNSTILDTADKANRAIDLQQKLLDDTLTRAQKAEAERDELKAWKDNALTNLDKLEEILVEHGLAFPTKGNT